MKKITFQVIKKSQVLTIVVTLMLVVAGYLNYTYDPNKNFDVELTGKIEDNLGDAILVDSKNVETNVDEIIETVNKKGEDNVEDYFIQTKIDRTNSYAEQIEIYENMMENNSLTEAQKSTASSKIAEINNQRNAIIIAENLIKLKGFDEIVILVNEDSINIVVKSDKLSEKQVAQIQNIIMHEFDTKVENIHITNK